MRDQDFLTLVAFVGQNTFKEKQTKVSVEEPEKDEIEDEREEGEGEETRPDTQLLQSRAGGQGP